jgi:hypothetical protein
MAHYLIMAWDGTDAGARERRLAARPLHFANIAPMTKSGQLVIGGPILNDADEMIGSTCIVAFDTRAELDHWLATDPYVTGRVWQKIEVHRIKVTAQGTPG